MVANATVTTLSADDILRLSARGERFELIDGVLAPMSPTGKEHGDIEAYIAWIFNSHVIPRRLGKIVVGEVLFELDAERGIDRAPDVAFIRRVRWQDQK